MIIKDNLFVKEIDIGNIKQCFAVIHQLRPHLSEQEYISLAKEMHTAGYKVFCLFEDKNIVAYAGVAILTNLYYGRHLWVYDLVSDKNRRGKGYGKILLDYLENFAHENGCSSVALSSGLQRTDAHRFYENKVKYQKISYVFKKDLC